MPTVGYRISPRRWRGTFRDHLLSRRALPTCRAPPRHSGRSRRIRLFL